MPYEAYKLVHLAAIFIFLSGTAALLLGGRPKAGLWTMVTGISAILILVSGMGLLARIGQGFPLWVAAKLVLWLILAGAGHLVAKRFPERAVAAYWATNALAVAAAWLAIYQPF